jgi:hypothetical protein
LSACRAHDTTIGAKDAIAFAVQWQASRAALRTGASSSARRFLQNADLGSKCSTVSQSARRYEAAMIMQHLSPALAAE